MVTTNAEIFDFVGGGNVYYDVATKAYIAAGWTMIVAIGYDVTPAHEFNKLIEWCSDNSGIWRRSGPNFFFKDEQDAIMFTLRFGGVVSTVSTAAF